MGVASSSGFRKAELFQSNSETFYLTWELVSWIIDGPGCPDPSNDQLQNMKEGDFAVITPPPSKSDQFNTVWGTLPVYLPYKDESRNAADSLKNLAIKVGPSFRANAHKKAVFVNNSK